MHNQIPLAALAVLVVEAAAKRHSLPIPVKHDQASCNAEISQPSWSECEDLFKSIDQDTLKLGPGTHEGEIFSNDNCAIHFIACSESDAPWDLDVARAGEMFRAVEKTCEAGKTGGLYHHGNAYAVVSSPKDSFLGQEKGGKRLAKKWEATDEEIEAHEEWLRQQETPAHTEDKKVEPADLLPDAGRYQSWAERIAREGASKRSPEDDYELGDGEVFEEEVFDEEVTEEEIEAHRVWLGQQQSPHAGYYKRADKIRIAGHTKRDD